MHHGSKGFEVTAPRSRFYQGGFGRIFPDLDPWAPPGVPDHLLEEHFLQFASEKMAEVVNGVPEDLAALDTPQAAGAPGNGNSDLPSGYVYFGQFVDHDLTLDVTPLSDAEVDPNRLHNFRTPRLDLDCLYGMGPDAQPHLYEHVGGAFTGKLISASLQDPAFSNLPPGVRDLQRNGEGRALIGDPRNDENAIVAQVHTAFLLAHNTLVERAKALPGGSQLSGAQLFERARKTLKRLYQWIVWKDFVARIADRDVHKIALRADKQPDGRSFWKLGYKEDVYSWRNQPFMPLEFSVAAYRFGHTLVRNAYQTNGSSVAAGFGKFFPIFSTNADNDVGGGRPLGMRRVLQWDWFLTMTTSAAGLFPQRARAFDTKLSAALLHLLEDPAAPGDPAKVLNVLAARNLTRGVRMKLPAGSDVALALGLKPLKIPDNEPQTLWYYVLKEAADQGASGGKGRGLGVVGSIIVCATFAGILKGDPLSWFNQEPTWEPKKDPLLKAEDNADGEAEGNNDWGLPVIIRLSGLPFQASDFQGITATA